MNRSRNSNEMANNGQ